MGARLALELCLSGELDPLAAVEDGNELSIALLRNGQGLIVL